MHASQPAFISRDDLDDEKACTSENVENCANIVTIENVQVLGLSFEDADFYRGFSFERRKAIIKKVGSEGIIISPKRKELIVDVYDRSI